MDRFDVQPCECSDDANARACARCRQNRDRIARLYRRDYSDELLEELTRPDQPSKAA